MRAHILSIGSELILGHLTDTNATYLAQELVAMGVELLHVTQVGDDRARIAATIRGAAAESDLVICTGGVGPTEDDLTREAIADVVGETPTVDAALLTTLRAFFAGRGLPMPERNAKQAWVIPSAETLANPVGTAPGWFVRHGTTRIVAMPGVPREMFRMWREQAVPRIQAELTGRVVNSITYKTLGIGESAAEQVLDDLVNQPNPIVATYAKDDGVHVRVTGIAETSDEAEQLRDLAARAVAARLAPFIYANDDTTLPHALTTLLRRHGETIAVAERGSGGRFATLLATDDATADVLTGAFLVSESDNSTASELAQLALERLNASLGLGLTAEVVPGDLGIYTGTVTVALAGSRQCTEASATRAAYPEIQRRAAMTAADVLRRALISAQPD